MTFGDFGCQCKISAAGGVDAAKSGSRFRQYVTEGMGLEWGPGVEIVKVATRDGGRNAKTSSGS